MNASAVERSWMKSMNWLLQTDLMISILTAEVVLEAQLNEFPEEEEEQG